MRCSPATPCRCVVASASTVGVGDWNEFSAACWFFGKNLYDKLQIPIGLMSNNWGGTIVQAWSSPEALKKCTPKEERYLQKYVPQAGPNDPSTLWNAMIIPVLPMTITGVIWYQGESNAAQPDYYACAFPVMINDWRAKWKGDTPKDFGFYFVQLAPWNNTNLNSESLTRLAQIYAITLPNVGVATAMDLGDPGSPFGDIHPRNKQEVGRRLSLIARALTYKENVQYLGPMAHTWSIVSQSPDAVVRIEFEEESIGGGLVAKRENTCATNLPANQCAGFDIGTEDGKWVNATMKIDTTSSILLSASVASKVTGVRYAWANYPLATLYNTDSLPAFPFAFPNPINPVKIL